MQIFWFWSAENIGKVANIIAKVSCDFFFFKGVNEYTVEGLYQSVGIFVRIGSPPPPLPQVSVFTESPLPTPLEPKGLAGVGVGGANSDDWRESLALCVHYSVVYTVQQISLCTIPPVNNETKDDRPEI